MKIQEPTLPNPYNIENLDSLLSQLFQLNTKVYLNNDVIAKGIFVIFTHKNYQYKFVFDQIGSKRKGRLTLPIPFDYTITRVNDQTILTFDYRLKALLWDDGEAIELYRKIHKPNKSKYLNEVVEFRFDTSN